MMNLLVHWRKDPKKKAHIKGMARVAVYFGVLGVASTLLMVRSARAQVGQEGLELGRQLAARMTALVGEGKHQTQKLRLNGQSIYVSNAVVNDPAKAVLDRFSTYCSKNLAQSPAEWNGLVNAPGELGDAAKVTGESGVIRAGTDEEGVVICFAKGESSKEKLTDALKAFGETGDLSAIGELRYAYVQSSAEGKSNVLTAWTHERFSVTELMPPEGTDAAGTDIPGLPRPPGSWRMLAATSEGTGYAVNVYRSDEPTEKLVAFYESEMAKLGYTGGTIPLTRPDADPADARQSSTKAGLTFAKEATVFTLGITTENGKSYVAAGLGGMTARATE